MALHIPINRASLNKISISFTWDDNSIRHSTIVAPLFLEHAFRCSFYVNPGENEFDIRYAPAYRALSEVDFEIGSHSFTHQYMTSLPTQLADSEIKQAVTAIIENTSRYPLTFAFPNHDYTDHLLVQARHYHLETRNTLPNSARFSIKTTTKFEELVRVIEQAISKKNNLVFSGHSIMTDTERSTGEIGEGYQPMSDSLLRKILVYLKSVDQQVDVVTFSQAAVREWVKRKAQQIGLVWFLSSEKLTELEKFQITQQNIISLL